MIGAAPAAPTRESGTDHAAGPMAGVDGPARAEGRTLSVAVRADGAAPGGRSLRSGDLRGRRADDARTRIPTPDCTEAGRRT
ncbi:hypothetical protein MFUR16E_19365 [Methylobacterium fujisawaense]